MGTQGAHATVGIELGGGSVRDVLTRDHNDDKPADKIERLSGLTANYHFGLVKPSEREIREANEQAGEHAVQAARAKAMGTDFPAEPDLPSIYGKARLPAGQLLCYDPQCPRYRVCGGPVRDIVEWIRLRDNRFSSEALEIDGEVILAARECEVWDAVLSCGHFDQECTKPGWKPEDGPAHHKNGKRLPLDQVLEEIPKGDPDQEDYWRRMYAENHPDPAPFTRCHTCARMRTITAYQRVGWLAGKKTPVKPGPTSRKTLERRLGNLESQAAQLREQLENLPSEE